MPLRIVSLGDSIVWGQGLSEADKFDVLVRDALADANPGITLWRLAHSGAVIGVNPVEGSPADGEVPMPQPTIIQQCDNFNDSPETVDLVLLDGGINDVDVRTILNPFVPFPILIAKTRNFCHASMLVLLRKTVTRFSKPDCKIRVTGYYPIVSAQSHFPSVIDLLGCHGIMAPDFIDKNVLVRAVIDRCEKFFSESTASIEQAVAEAGDARIAYVAPGFTDANSVFAPQTLLWGLKDDLDLSPEDEVANARRASCNAAFDELQIVEREECYRAPVGHPNVLGAKHFAQKILESLP